MERAEKSSLGWFYWVTLSCLGLWMIGQILVVIQHKSEKRRLERAYGELTKKREALQRQAQTLQVELERLQSPERLTRHAIEELGMQLPTRSQIVQMAVAPSSKTAPSLEMAVAPGSKKASSHGDVHRLAHKAP